MFHFVLSHKGIHWIYWAKCKTELATEMQFIPGLGRATLDSKKHTTLLKRPQCYVKMLYGSYWIITVYIPSAHVSSFISFSTAEEGKIVQDKRFYYIKWDSPTPNCFISIDEIKLGRSKMGINCIIIRWGLAIVTNGRERNEEQ